MGELIETEAEQKSEANFLLHPERSRGIPMRKL